MTAPAERLVAVMTHPRRADALRAAVDFVRDVNAHGVRCIVLADETTEQMRAELSDVELAEQAEGAEVELVVVFGGDGSILRASEWAQPRNVPVLGVNLGHVGFLAELERSDLWRLAEQVVKRAYTIERRVTISVELREYPTGPVTWSSFAVNEVSIEKLSRQKMIQVLARVDGLPVSRWGCDGILIATPTGSTAYAFSAGGPVMWPDLEAFLMLPLSAHALFARPMVLGPGTEVEVELVGGAGAVLWCDGRRTVDAPLGSLIRVVRSQHYLKLARLSEQPFTNRLVKKFGLRVDGWRSDADSPTG